MCRILHIKNIIFSQINVRIELKYYFGNKLLVTNIMSHRQTTRVAILVSYYLLPLC